MSVFKQTFLEKFAALPAVKRIAQAMPALNYSQLKKEMMAKNRAVALPRATALAQTAAATATPRAAANVTPPGMWARAMKTPAGR